MREESGLERSGPPRAILGPPRRSKSSAERNNGGIRGQPGWQILGGGGDGGNWSEVRSRKRKARQSDAGRRDRSRVSERHDDAGSGQQVRQSRDGFRVHHRSSKVQEEATQPSGNIGKRSKSPDARFDMNGRVSDFVVSDQRGRDTSGIGPKVSYYFTNIPECLPIFLLRHQFEVCSILTDVFIA